MKIIVEIKKQLFKDFYLVTGSAVGLYILYSSGTIIEKCIHSSEDNSTSFSIAKDIYKRNGINGFFKGSTFSICYKIVLETLKDIQKKVYNCGDNNSSGDVIVDNNSNASNINNSNSCTLWNKIKNKFKFNKNNNNSTTNNNNGSILNININTSYSNSNNSSTNNGLNLILFSNLNYKSEFLNILEELLECPLYLIRDCIVISPNQFSFTQFFKSLKSIHIIKLIGYYGGISIIKFYAEILIEVIIKEIQNSQDQKKPNSLFNYLKFIILINNNLIIKSYIQSLILCPIDFIRIQYSLKIIESMNMGVPIGSYVENSIQSPFAILKRFGLSGVYNGFNISFLNNILVNILIKYLYNIELILNLIIITKNKIK